MVVRSVSANNEIGLYIQSAQSPLATLRVSQSTVTGNARGWQTSNSAVLLSAGDNTVEGNGSNEGVMPLYAKK